MVIWTKHSRAKMRYYGISEKRLLGVLRKPDRKEEGIALNTIASMQITGTKKHPTEMWIMYQVINPKSEIRNPKIRIISGWRYPGRTPEDERPIIPDDILRDLKDLINE